MRDFQVCFWAEGSTDKYSRVLGGCERERERLGIGQWDEDEEIDYLL